MKVSALLKKHGLSLKLKSKFLDVDWKPQDTDEQAAWELYIELLTRIATQPLAEDEGCEVTTLESIHSLFPITRNILKDKGRGCAEFSKIAIVVLNQVIRPFTSKWHLLNKKDAFKDRTHCAEFRAELKTLQEQLKNYTSLLAEIAHVEDFTELEGDNV